MKPRSFRTTLALANGLVFAAIVAATGLALMLVNQQRLRAGLDRDLVDGARRLAQGPPRGFQGQFFRGQGRPNGGSQAGGPVGPGQPGGPFGPDVPPSAPPDFGGFPPMPQGPPGRGGPPPFDPYRDAREIADIRRPRFFGFGGPRQPDRGDQPFDPVALNAARPGPPLLTVADFGDRKIRVATAVRPLDGGGTGKVQIARELGEIDRVWQAQLATLLLVLPFAVGIAGGAAWVLAGRAALPVAKMTQTASEISTNPWGTEMPSGGDAEFQQLAAAFNGLLARLRESYQSQQTAYQQLEAAFEQQKMFIADASHELRTPLSRLQLALSNAADPGTTTERRLGSIEVAQRASESMNRLVQQLLTLARADAGQLGLQLAALDLRLPIADALPEEVAGGPTLNVLLPDHPVIGHADYEAVRRIAANLVENAIRHTPSSGAIEVRLTGDTNGWELTVSDNGEGIPREHQARIWDRFYRVDSARNRADGGCGLGLSIVRSLAEEMGAQVGLASSPGKGTRFSIRFSKTAQSK